MIEVVNILLVAFVVVETVKGRYGDGDGGDPHLLLRHVLAEVCDDRLQLQPDHGLDLGPGEDGVAGPGHEHEVLLQTLGQLLLRPALQRVQLQQDLLGILHGWSYRASSGPRSYRAFEAATLSSGK